NALSYHPAHTGIDIILRGGRCRVVNLPTRGQNELRAIAWQIGCRDRKDRSRISSAREVLKIAELFAGNDIEREFFARCLIEMGVGPHQRLVRRGKIRRVIAPFDAQTEHETLAK